MLDDCIILQTANMGDEHILVAFAEIIHLNLNIQLIYTQLQKKTASF